MAMASVNFEGAIVVAKEAKDGATEDVVPIRKIDIAVAFQVVLESLGKLQFSMLRLNLRIGKTEEVVNLMLLGLKLHRDRVRRLEYRFDSANSELENRCKRKIDQDPEEQRSTTQSDYIAKLYKRLEKLEQVVAVEEKMGKALLKEKQKEMAEIPPVQKKNILRNRSQFSEVVLGSDNFDACNYLLHQKRRNVNIFPNQKLPNRPKILQTLKQGVFSNGNGKSPVIETQKHEQGNEIIINEENYFIRKETQTFKPKTHSLNKKSTSVKQKREELSNIHNPITSTFCKENVEFKNKRYNDEVFKSPTPTNQKKIQNDFIHKHEMHVSRIRPQSFTQKFNSKDKDKQYVTKEQKKDENVKIQKTIMHVSRKDMHMCKQKNVSNENIKCFSSLKLKKGQQVDNLIRQKKGQQVDNVMQQKMNVLLKETQLFKQKNISDENYKSPSPIQQKKEQLLTSFQPKTQSLRKETRAFKQKPSPDCLSKSKVLEHRILHHTKDHYPMQYQKNPEKQIESKQELKNPLERKELRTTSKIQNTNQISSNSNQIDETTIFNRRRDLKQRMSSPSLYLSSSEISMTSSKIYINNSISEHKNVHKDYPDKQVANNHSMLWKIPQHALTSQEMRAISQLLRETDNQQNNESNSLRNLLEVLEKIVVSVEVVPQNLQGPRFEIKNISFDKRETQDSKEIIDESGETTDFNKSIERQDKGDLKREDNEQIKRTYSPNTMLEVLDDTMNSDEPIGETSERDEFVYLERKKQKTEKSLDLSINNYKQAENTTMTLPNSNNPLEKSPSESRISSCSSIVTATFSLEHPTPTLQQQQQQQQQQNEQQQNQQEAETYDQKSSMDQCMLQHLRDCKVARSLSYTSNMFVPSKQLDVLGRRLLKSTRDGSISEVRKLLQQGADPNFVNKCRWTPLHMAAGKAHAEIMSLLLKRGANVHARTPSGLTPLHMAACNDDTGRCVANLIKAGAHLNSINKFGTTPLHMASECGNVVAVGELLDAGACKNLKNDEGRLPVDITRNDEILELLS